MYGRAPHLGSLRTSSVPRAQTAAGADAPDSAACTALPLPPRKAGMKMTDARTKSLVAVRTFGVMTVLPAGAPVDPDQLVAPAQTPSHHEGAREHRAAADPPGENP